MAQPQLRPGAFAGAARISGSGVLVYSVGIITSITRTGPGIYQIGLSPGISANEHTFRIQPILGFAAEASGSVNVVVTPPLLQTVVGGVAADLDCYIEVTRVRTADGIVSSTFPAVPAAPPPPSSGNVTGPASSTDNAIVRFDGTTGKIIQDYTSGAPIVDDTGRVGIGTTNPGRRLHVFDPTLDFAALFESGDSGGGIELRDNATTPSSVGLLAVGNNLKLNAGGAERMRIDSAGQVTIFNVLLGTGVLGGTPVSGAGTRIMWIPAKAAFRVGVVTGTEWDDANIGVRSFASGKDCIASGADSTAMGDGCNASGSNTWAMGRSCVASSAEAVAMGTSCTASAEGAVAMGSNCNATGRHSFAAGRNATAVEKALATGARSNARLIGTHAHASGRILADGDAQTIVAPVMRQTTDATLTELTLEGATPGVNSRLVLQDDTCWTFSILVVVRNLAGGENAAYAFEGIIKRDTGAGTTALVGFITKTVLAEDVAAWDVTVDADSSAGSLRVRATGEAAKTINWFARVTLSEVAG